LFKFILSAAFKTKLDKFSLKNALWDNQKRPKKTNASRADTNDMESELF